MTIESSPEHREFLDNRRFEARERLKYINTALKNLVSINENQRAQIEEMTAELSRAYDESVDRAWSVVFDLMTSLPADKFMNNYAVAKSRLDAAMKHRTGMLTTPLDAQAKKKIQSEILRIQMGKERMAEIYEGSSKLLNVFKGTNYAYDIDKWNTQTKGKANTTAERAPERT